MSVEPNTKYQFSEPFKSQFEDLLRGRNPTPPAEKDKPQQYAANAMAKKPPSVKQLALLNKLGVMMIPGTMQEASALIDRAMRK